LLALVPLPQWASHSSEEVVEIAILLLIVNVIVESVVVLLSCPPEVRPLDIPLISFHLPEQ
jgi:hypothetical protein